MAWMDTYAAQIGSWRADYVSAEVITSMSSSHQLGIFFYMATDPALHIWMGVNDIPAGIDGVTADGTVFLGGGRLLNVPSLEVLCNGQSGSVSFGISGIDPATAAEVMAAMPPVRGKQVMIALTTLDQYYQPTASLIPVWSGTASHPSEESAVVAGEDNPNVTLSLAVISGNNTRSRPSGSLWSSAHQKALYPTDLGCDHTSRIARGVAPAWPF